MGKRERDEVIERVNKRLHQTRRLEGRLGGRGKWGGASNVERSWKPAVGSGKLLAVGLWVQMREQMKGRGRER